MFKKILTAVAAGSLLVASSITMAKTLTTYDEISNSLAAGMPVYVMIDGSKCQIDKATGNKYGITRLGFRVRDLRERVGSIRGGKKMRMLAAENTGVIGDKRFVMARDLLIVMEDGTVNALEDEINPLNYTLYSRVWMKCKLSADGSGGVTVTQLRRK